MIWQDIVIAALGFLFSIMLIPQIRDSLNGKFVNTTSSALTALGLFIMGATFVTLELWFTSISTFLNGAVWLLLLILALKGDARVRERTKEEEQGS